MALYLHHLVGGQPAFYIDKGTGYALSGQPLFHIADMSAHDAAGSTVYSIVNEHFVPSAGSAWPAAYFDASDIETEQLTDTTADPAWVEHLKTISGRKAEVFVEELFGPLEEPVEESVAKALFEKFADNHHQIEAARAAAEKPAKTLLDRIFRRGQAGG